MNINEVEKHVKSELTVQIIIYILIGLCFFVSLFAILTTPVKAVASNYSADVTSNLAYVPGYCNYNNFCVRYQSSQSWASLQVNENFTAPTDKFAFLVNHSVYYNAPSTISLWVDNATFQNSGNTCTIRDDNNQFIGCTIEKVNDNRINLNFTTPSSVSGRLSFFVNTTNGYLTFAPNAKVTKAVLFQTIPSGNQNDYSDILNNQNQNTSDIISNNNSNTENIINNNTGNTQNVISNLNTNFLKLLGELATVCPNLFDNTNIAPNFNINADGSYSFNTSASLTVIEVTPGQAYTLKADVNRQWVYNFALAPTIFDNAYGSTRVVSTGYMISFVVPEGYNRFILRSFPSNNENNATQNVMMIKGRNLPASAFGTYCVHGTVSRNKLDDVSAGIEGAVSAINDTNDTLNDVKDIQQDTYDYISDDSNPSVNQSDLNNVIGQVQIQDPLNYLLTLPINLLTKLNTVISSGTCSRASFGELYGTELYLPCINFENYLGSSLWSTIDTIVGIGLLAIILKKFYDTISNILSLGKEEEIRKGMELPTPMEFFAQILGGGK